MPTLIGDDLPHPSSTPKILTRAELIEEVGLVVRVGRKDAQTIVEATLGGIVRTLQRGDRVELRGFGTFSTRKRQPRVGRNPKTGVRVQVPAKRVPSFRASQQLRELVNKLP
jgi:integration host factor subunit beta